MSLEEREANLQICNPHPVSSIIGTKLQICSRSLRSLVFLIR